MSFYFSSFFVCTTARAACDEKLYRLNRASVQLVPSVMGDRPKIILRRNFGFKITIVPTEEDTVIMVDDADRRIGNASFGLGLRSFEKQLYKDAEGPAKVSSAALSPDCKYLVVGVLRKENPQSPTKSYLYVYEVSKLPIELSKKAEPVSRIELDLSRYEISELGFSLDGKYIIGAVMGLGGEIFILDWNHANGQMSIKTQISIQKARGFVEKNRYPFSILEKVSLYRVAQGHKEYIKAKVLLEEGASLTSDEMDQSLQFPSDAMFVNLDIPVE
jgi:hypothetical protein